MKNQQKWRKSLRNWLPRSRWPGQWLTAAYLVGCIAYAHAQDGIAGINAANEQVRSYFDEGTKLMYAVGAILGLIGAVKVLCAVNTSIA